MVDRGADLHRVEGTGRGDIVRAAALYLVAAVMLVVIVSVAWATRSSMPVLPPNAVQTTYIAQPGDTIASVAESLDVAPEALVEANDLPATTTSLQQGQEIEVPADAPTWRQSAGVHGAGILAQILGVFMSFWLSILTGILPKTPIRRQVLGMSLVLGLASYAAAQSVATETAHLTPQFLFSAIKDGFLWSAAFPMFARALGIKETPTGTGIASSASRGDGAGMSSAGAEADSAASSPPSSPRG